MSCPLLLTLSFALAVSLNCIQVVSLSHHFASLSQRFFVGCFFFSGLSWVSRTGLSLRSIYPVSRLHHYRTAEPVEPGPNNQAIKLPRCWLSELPRQSGHRPCLLSRTLHSGGVQLSRSPLASLQSLLICIQETAMAIQNPARTRRGHLSQQKGGQEKGRHRKVRFFTFRRELPVNLGWAPSWRHV